VSPLLRLEVSQLRSAQLAEAVQLLAAAFIDEPLIAAILPDPVERVRLIGFYFEHVVRHGLQYGEIYATEPLAALAIWIPPPGAWPTQRADDTLEPFDLTALLGPTAINRLARLSYRFERSRWRAAPGLHSHLMVLGVDPTQQRQGIGSALITWLFDRHGAADITCCLQTSRPELLPFYQRHGFTVAHADLEPATDLHFWTLTRPAQPS
jgi:GNAT superfamily N-acetyltransferase